MAKEIETSTTTVDGLGAYLARPAGGSAQGMLLLPMITGIGAQIREWADEVARRGITALTWDPWHGVSSDDTSFEELHERMTKLDDETCLDEQRRLLDHLLGELGCARAGVVGWCLGGRFALILGGRDERLANVIAFHPTVPGTPAPNHTADAVEHTARIKAPVMMCYPGKDDLVPAESFQRLQSALQTRAEAASIVHVYPQAEHGYTDRRRHGNPVNAEAFAVSWPQALEFAAATTR
ncbi:carboxymethylenebutenolidase [Amycolatopsis bartoniae]|uniref:Carboxymethylenebutenolidase n=1 Tax=Amycolatopsis bartoniae TaxID=941986 RepID=A0A8H9MDJ9_9PSEU|nr:dienelactone hydrolase family protein [Amycolatopsis bartoniae]MBB2938749.1 carboxymethylenebutenolidase [Amycolatopsis bartoniae]TVT11473.1 dienelactone hydrolase family protein [Amycolatopsis bartoniae]GHF79892.1 carboxymethylenebutenolidase [Amycolatopsis bartoniae]